MNILHVTLGFYPAIAWGGPVKVVHQNGTELVRRGHRVTVYCTNLLDKKNKIQKGTFEREMDGMRIVYFDTWNLSWWPGTLGPIWSPDFQAHVKREISSFDVVHLNGYRSPANVIVARAARNAGIPIIMQPQGTLPIGIKSVWVKRFYDSVFGRAELGGIGAFIALQDIEQRQALDYGVARTAIEVIPNGIDARDLTRLPELGSFRSSFGFDLERPLILFLGRINKTKGADMLIHAFAQLQSPSNQLAIVGPDDGQLTIVKKLIEKYNLGHRVGITGPVSESYKLAAFQDCDLFVLPSIFDAYPTTVMEACLFGKPMVITEGCGNASQVRNRVAEVVPFDADEFASAMQRLLTDRERYEFYRSNSKAVFADTFSIQTAIDRLEAVYERVIRGRAN